jgi:transcriptional regulator with XRE-family HTH domain
MNIKSNQEIGAAFKLLINHNSQAEVQEFEALKAHFEIMLQFEVYMEQNAVSKKTLAAQVGTSASYITQLFRGDKLINLDMRVRIQNVLGLESRQMFFKKGEEVITTKYPLAKFRTSDFLEFKQPSELDSVITESEYISVFA